MKVTFCAEYCTQNDTSHGKNGMWPCGTRSNERLAKTVARFEKPSRVRNGSSSGITCVSVLRSTCCVQCWYRYDSTAEHAIVAAKKTVFLLSKPQHLEPNTQTIGARATEGFLPCHGMGCPAQHSTAALALSCVGLVCAKRK